MTAYAYGGGQVYSADFQMRNLGQAIKEYVDFYWIGICLSWLIIPSIILFVKYVKVIMALNDVRKIAPDPELNTGYNGLLWGIILNFLAYPIMFIFGSFGVLFIFASPISILIGHISLEKWARNLSYSRNTPSMQLFAQGMADWKTATIVSCCCGCIGIFMIPGAARRASDGLLGEYNSASSYAMYGPTIGGYNPSVPPPSPAMYGNPPPMYPSYQTSPYNQNPNSATYMNQGGRLCPTCGNPLPPDAKFCAGCGNRV